MSRKPSDFSFVGHKEDGASGICLWAESPEEARNFLIRAKQSDFAGKFDKIFVAKRSAKSRGNNYTGGEYYRTTDDESVDVYDEVILAPKKITELVQWCTCDIMVSKDGVPVFVLEDTTHIVRMNLYQRFPRLALAARTGVPSAVLQGTRGLEFRLRGDRWGFYRYMQGFEALARVHPETASIPFWYLDTAEDERKAQNETFEYLNALLSGEASRIKHIRAEKIHGIREIVRSGFQGVIARDIPCIQHSDENEVVVRVGARPDKKSWTCKGSGQMDPYLGLILAAKYIYCFDEKGKKIKNLVVEFTYLPKNFWFFNKTGTTSLYKTLAKVFADEERFLG